MVNGYSAEWLGKGFDWVYNNEIIAKLGSPRSGDVVDIVGQDGRHLGVGIAADGKVAVRRFRVDRGPIDADFLRSRMESALSRRRIPEATTAWRWVHGENDDLPGLRVDVWANHATVALDDPSLEFLLKPVVDCILAHPVIDTIWENTRQSTMSVAQVPLRVDASPVTVRMSTSWC